MRRPGWRWAVAAALVGALVATPTLAGALPAGAVSIDSEQLLERIRASETVGWSGYGESRGTLVVPDVRELSDLPSLVGDTTRIRAWWRSPDDWRVNAHTLVGENDVTKDAEGGWIWSSADRQALRIRGEVDLQLPRAADLMAPALGRRLAGTSDVTASAMAPRRVAGRTAAGVRLVPNQPAATTVDTVDLWADPQTGLVLRVDIVVQGRTALSTLLLDLDLAAPPPARTAFPRPYDATVAVEQAPDIAAAIDRFAPYALPGSLAGLPRRPRSPLSIGGGVGTYGDGFTAVALLPLPQDLARRILRRVDADDDDGQAIISTRLVNALVAVEGRRGYLIVGTVPDGRLTLALRQLRRSPPARINR